MTRLVIGDKAVMTARTGAGTEQRPTPDERRGLPVLDETQAVELAALASSDYSGPRATSGRPSRRHDPDHLVVRATVHPRGHVGLGHPRLIVGHFDPIRRAADPHRRTDLFDARGDTVPVSDTITGFPGAAGVVEGIARVTGHRVGRPAATGRDPGQP